MRYSPWISIIACIAAASASAGRGTGAAGRGGDDPVGTARDRDGRYSGCDDPGPLAGKHLFCSLLPGLLIAVMPAHAGALMEGDGVRAHRLCGADLSPMFGQTFRKGTPRTRAKQLRKLALRFGRGHLEGLCLREAQVERGSVAGLGADGELPAMGGGQRRRDGQAKPGTTTGACPGVVGAVEPLEHV